MKEKFTKLLNKQEEKMTKEDYIIVSIIIVLYAILSFINLGSFKNPQTFYTFESDEEVILELPNEQSISKLRIFNGDEVGTYELYTSTDNIGYNQLDNYTGSGAFAWDEVNVNRPLRYLKLIPLTQDSTIGEISIYNENNEQVNIIDSISTETSVQRLYDEPTMVPEKISYLNTSYFDEIYFARTAYDYKEGLEAYEWVHPPLGKLLQAIPVVLFNKMAPFYYRLMGNLAGIIMVFVMYLFGKQLFKTRKWAIFASLLMCFDTFHFVQTRIGTVDSFLVLFIMLSLYFMYRHITKKNTKYNLLLSGIFFGLSICVKWIGFLGGLALAIMYFTDFIKEKKPVRQSIIQGFAFFVIIPFIFYITVYFIYPNNQVTYTDSIKDIYNQTLEVYAYHSTLEEPHFFSSKWYTWPLSYKPVWYYSHQASATTRGTISAIGNIVIWWLGLLAIPYLLYKVIKKKDKNAFYLVVSILSLWLPFIFIGRVMFQYHYFPTVPFAMLAVATVIKDLEEKTKKSYIAPIYLALVAIFFIIYYPVISGIEVPSTYLESLKLFKSWYF